LGRPAADAVIELVPTVAAPASRGSGTVLIDQRHLRFAPSVLGIQAGTVVEFRNSDPIMHNVFSPQRRGADFDLGTYPQEESRTHLFDEPGTYVILCHVHPEMAAWVVVSASPYVGVTDENGSFVMDSVPPGDYQTMVWYRRRSASGGTISIGEGGPAVVQVDIGR
jgi:plastocyanin